VTVVAPPSAKTIEVSVEVPVPDMTQLDAAGAEDDDGPRRPSIWPAVEERILDLIESHRTTIIFVNARRGAERLCARLNELAAERANGVPIPLPDRRPAEIMAQSGQAMGATPI